MKYAYILPMALLAMAAGLTGCSTVKTTAGKTGNTVKGWFESGKEKTETEVTQAKKEAIDKTDQILVAIAKEQERGAITGDWAIESVLGQKAVGEDAPFIKFVPSEGRIYGNNGCNTLNADYKTSYVDRTIEFTHLATTMRLCGTEGITDVLIGQALGMTKTYTWEDSNYEYHLYFYDKDGQQVMELMHRDFQFLDGTWAVKKIDGEKVSVKGMKLALDVDQKKMHGNTGCNIINGDLETDLETANSISFSGIRMTKMACPDSGWETRLIVALEDAITAKKVSDDKIVFLGSNGQEVMELERTTDTDID